MKAERESEAVIRNRNMITIPPKIMDHFKAEVGDCLIFKKKNDLIIVGRRKRTIIEEETIFKVEKND